MSQEKMKLQYVQTPGIIKTLDNAQNAMITMDGLSNVVAGLGGSSDKRTYNRWSHQNDPFNDFGQLEAAYRNSWLARQIVDIPANDATREWRKFKGDVAEKIEKEEKRLNIQTHTNSWAKNARLYGGSLMLMITGQDLSKPLNVNAVKQGDLKKVLVFDRWYLSGTAINITNPLSDNFLQTEYYFLAGTGQPIHYSHICRMNGAFLPLRLNQYEQGFGDSVLRKCLSDISDVSSTNANIANLVFSANVDTIKRKGLFAALATGEDQKIVNRYSKLNLLKSTINLTLLDEDETYERNQLAFSGLPQIQQMQMQWISGAADIPMTRLFGSSPGGLNATGESDLNNYYDSVRSEQEGAYREGLEKLDQVMLRSAGIENPDDVEFEWNPLYQDSNTERATQRLADAQTDQIYLERGVITEVQVAKRLQSNGDYSIEDTDIKELEDLMTEEEETLRLENEELRNRAAANEEELNSANERAEKAVADANETIIMVRQNFDSQVAKINKKVSDAQAEVEKITANYEKKIADTNSEFEQKLQSAAIEHKKVLDSTIANLIAEHESESVTKQEAFDAAIRDLESKHAQRVNDLENEHLAMMNDAEAKYSEETEKLNQQINDANAEAESKIKEAEKERDRLVADAESQAQKLIDEANDKNEVDIKLITDGVNKQLADQKAEYEQAFQVIKNEADQVVNAIKSECEQKIADSEVKANARIDEIVVEMEEKIEQSKLQTDVVLDALRAEAYKAFMDAQKEQDENQDDEVKDGDQPDGKANGTDEAGTGQQEVDGKTPKKDESTEGDGAE